MDHTAPSYSIPWMPFSPLNVQVLAPQSLFNSILPFPSFLLPSILPQILFICLNYFSAPWTALSTKLRFLPHLALTVLFLAQCTFLTPHIVLRYLISNASILFTSAFRAQDLYTHNTAVTISYLDHLTIHSICNDFMCCYDHSLAHKALYFHQIFPYLNSQKFILSCPLLYIITLVFYINLELPSFTQFFSIQTPE